MARLDITGDLISLFDKYAYDEPLAESGSDGDSKFERIVFCLSLTEQLEHRFSFDFDNGALSLIEYGVYHKSVEKFIAEFDYWTVNGTFIGIENPSQQNQILFQGVTLGENTPLIDGKVLWEQSKKKVLSYVENILSDMAKNKEKVIDNFKLSMENPLNQVGFNEKITFRLLMKYIKYWDFEGTKIDQAMFDSVWSPLFAIDDPLGFKSLRLFNKYHIDLDEKSVNLQLVQLRAL